MSQTIWTLSVDWVSLMYVWALMVLLCALGYTAFDAISKLLESGVQSGEADRRER